MCNAPRVQLPPCSTIKSTLNYPNPQLELNQYIVNMKLKGIFKNNIAVPKQNANENVNIPVGILLSKCSMIPSKNLNRVMRYGFLLLKLYFLL